MIKNPKKRKGFLNANVVRSVTFILISICLFASVFASIMAIWDFADPDVFWRLIATFAVIGLGTWIFAVVNGAFGREEKGESRDER